MLEREVDDGARATYRASIYTPDAEFTATATLEESGAVELTVPGGATRAPSELHERLLSIARLVARDAAKRRADGLAAWPARILRWRK